MARCIVTRIAIIGGGRAATLHAEAALATPGVDLVGVGGRAEGTAGALAAGIGSVDMTIDELIDRCDGLVIAVPPRAVPEVLDRIPTTHAILIESPVGLPSTTDHPIAATAVNLLHAPTVRRALRAIMDLGDVHHLVLRSRAIRPEWGSHGTPEFGGGALIDPAAGALPVLLAAAGVPVDDVTATVRRDGPVEHGADLFLGLVDGRKIRAGFEWTDDPGETELEAASDAGVVTVRLWPYPRLEIDGEPVPLPEDPPLVALGFVEQMRRFSSAAAGRSAAWPSRAVGDGIMTIAEAAARSAIADGAVVSCGGRASVDPATVFAGEG